MPTPSHEPPPLVAVVARKSWQQIVGIVCVLGYLDFRFTDCGWRKTFPKLDAFHEKMMQRDSVKNTVPPPA